MHQSPPQAPYGICRRIVVTQDCTIPAKHEANVPIRMEDDSIPLPPGDWAIEPQGLGPGIMAARTLFSDSQSLLVARVLNNSPKPTTLFANSLLSMAEPVQCLSGAGCEPSDSFSADSDAWCASSLLDEPTLPVPPVSLSAMTSTDETDCLASSVAAATLDAMAPGSLPSPSGDQLEHIDSLLHGLPSDLTPDQRECAETFIRSYANVFSTSEYGGFKQTDGPVYGR